MIRGLFYAAGFLLWSALAAPVVLAAEAPPLRVGRVAAVEGSVAVRAGTGDWADAHVNDPVAAGMSVRTGAQGRAVLRIGAETVALTSDSEVELTDADAGATRLVLRRGRLAVVLSPADPVRAVDVAVEGRDVSLATPGAYDITSAGARTVAAGAAVAPRDGDPVVPAGGEDAGGFVAWAERQAGDDSGLQALHCVSPDLTGYETLDANGGWETVNGYGMVWFPRDLPEDWAPYRYGHWRWVAAWGWNWIDDMPWGFATSHYGRWASVPGADVGTERWGWVPGDRVANPAYAPALVAFLGTPGVGLSYSGGSGPAVAWFPLAPGEVYWPRYGDDPATIRRSNAGAVDDMAALEPAPGGGPPLAVLTATYRNRRFASVVPRASFVAGRPVAPSVLRLPDERLDAAPVLAGGPEIPPPAPRVAATPPAAVAHVAALARPRSQRPMVLASARLRGRGPAGHDVASRYQATPRPRAMPSVAATRAVASAGAARRFAVVAPNRTPPARQRLHFAAARHGVLR